MRCHTGKIDLKIMSDRDSVRVEGRLVLLIKNKEQATFLVYHSCFLSL
jgi:hypothetical protein